MSGDISSSKNHQTRTNDLNGQLGENRRKLKLDLKFEDAFYYFYVSTRILQLLIQIKNH